MGLGALFGMAGRKPADPTKQTLTAPAPTVQAPGSVNVATMPDSIRTAGAGAAMSALAAAQKARKKAGGGAVSSVAKPASTILTNAGAPKTLLGY